MHGANSLGAGLMLVLVSLGCAAAGVGLGTLLGSAVAGGFVGGVIGVGAAFRTVYVVYLRPLRDESLAKDYRHLTPRLEDDD